MHGPLAMSRSLADCRSSCKRKPCRVGKRVKNSRAVILFSTECSSCTRLAPKILVTSAEKRSVDELRTWWGREGRGGGKGVEN